LAPEWREERLIVGGVDRRREADEAKEADEEHGNFGDA
jgi:hypothetical protein